MSVIVLDATSRDANGYACCAYRSLKCDNPGCRVNASPERQAIIDAKREQAEEAERVRIRAIRDRMYAS